MDAMLENGPWFIHNNPFILKRWNPNVNIIQVDVGNVAVWVKFHGVPLTTFSEDELSVIATKLGTPLMLDSYTSDMCMQSCDECLKSIGSDVEKNLKNHKQAARGVPVSPNVGFKHVKQVFRPVSNKNNANTNGKKKPNVMSRKEVSNSNPFDALNSVKNDDDLCTNKGISKSAGSKRGNDSGYGTNSLLKQ
ncbi:ARID DNA-binding domain-containing protein [Tanacetum coccineum]